MTVAGSTTGWRSSLSDLDAALIDGLQRGFPVRERPFVAVGDRLDASASRVLDRVRHLHEEGIFRRVGPVLNPPVIGSSALGAISVPQSRVREAAGVVNAYDEVNHNYRRDHEWNLWFVVTAPTRTRCNEILAGIEAETGAPVLSLPMRTQYYIGLEFPVVNDDRLARERWDETTAAEPTRIDGSPLALADLEARVLLAVQDGLPLSETPYRDVAEDLGTPVQEVLSAIEDLRGRDAIKRIGCVVDHRAVGFDANCMVVWDVPDEALDDAGVAAGSHPSVTYCCERVRREAAGWPYSLFTMIHGRDRAAVEETIDALADGPLPYDHARLATLESLKQTGVRYRDLVATGAGEATSP